VSQVAKVLQAREAQRAHAKLSASGSKVWLTCTPSARLAEQFPDESSNDASQGTFAHAVFEHALLTYLGRPAEPVPASDFDTPELREYVQAAVDRSIEAIEQARSECADPVILVEQRLDFSPWVPEGFGTGDLVIITDKWVWVLDLKFGKGIFVDALGNTQMRLYGLGAYNELAHLYDMKSVRMTILQPRLDNWSSEELSVEELLGWAEHFVKPRAQLAWAGEGPFVAGEHCTSGFCRARHQCAARAEQAMAIAREEFALRSPELLSTEQLVTVLAKADLAIDWLNDVKEHALKAAKEGREIPGFKLVEGRSVRKYSDHDAVAQRLVEAGVPDAVIYERNVLGITAMEKALGKKRFNELLDGLITKPAGKATLVPVEDKRPALSSAASAAEDFK
jgi:hypothetical protein